MKVRTILFAIVAALFIPLVVGAIAVLGAASQLPGGQGVRLRGPHDLVGVYAQSSYAWVVPAGPGSVVIIDSGMDREATALRAEIGGRKVLAVLLTHAHVDHAQGVDALPDPPLYVGEGELPLLKGEVEPKGWLAAWMSGAAPPPRLPEEVVEVADGQELSFGTARIRAVAVPGHSGGSVAYLWRDVLFAGDAVLGEPQVMVMPSAFSDDEAQATQSVAALLPLSFDWLADGHAGLHKNRRDALFGLVGEAVVPATITMEDAVVDVDGEMARVDVRFEGLYSQAPWADARGLQPGSIVLDDGRRWVIAAMPVEAHRALWNRRVKGAGQTWTVDAGSQVPGTWLQVDQIGAVGSAGPSRGAVERMAADDLSRGAWAELSGTLTDFAPLAVGASHGEGHLDGVAVTLPVQTSSGLTRARVGQVVTVVGSVVAGAPSARLAGQRLCVGDVSCTAVAAEPLPVP